LPRGAAPSTRHLFQEDLGHDVEIVDGPLQACALRRRIDVVEGKERHVEQAEEFEGDVSFGLGEVKRVSAMVPGSKECLATKGVTARPAEGMPVTDGKAQVILKPLARNDTVLVIPAKRMRGLGGRPAKAERQGRLEETRG
jgi:hypothetical protein